MRNIAEMKLSLNNNVAWRKIQNSSNLVLLPKRIQYTWYIEKLLAILY